MKIYTIGIDKITKSLKISLAHYIHTFPRVNKSNFT